MKSKREHNRMANYEKRLLRSNHTPVEPVEGTRTIPDCIISDFESFMSHLSGTVESLDVESLDVESVDSFPNDEYRELFELSANPTLGEFTRHVYRYYDV